MARPLAALLLLVLIVTAGLWFFSAPPRAPEPAIPAAVGRAPAGPFVPALPASPRPARPGACGAPAAFALAAAANAASLSALPVTAFGRAEQGWAVYAPLTAKTIGAACDPQTPAFAAALGRWQAAQGLAGDGAMTPETLEALRLAWHARRPFVAATRSGQCPAPPPAAALAWMQPPGSYGRPIRLRIRALDAWRRMVAAARTERPEIAADPRLLSVFSGFRDPAEEAARCEDGGCGGPARARCSAHRTGLAADLYLGPAPGADPASTADADRLHQSRTPAYRWLVANAARFGWVNYPFEPWHWEWTGEAP